MPEREVVIGVHLYQPGRRAHHKKLSRRSTDPESIDWTRKIYEQAYHKQLQANILDAASFDILGTLHRELESINARDAKKISAAMKEMGVGEPYLHPILPDLSKIDKRILIRFGHRRFHQKTGRDPLVFWPPETAIDTDTLEALAESGYKAFICAPEQIQRNGRPDNQPTLIPLPSGKSIIALPFDRPVSSALAFENKQNADWFVNDHILPALRRVPDNGRLLAWTDDETFGHHDPNGHLFLQYLLFQALQKQGLQPIPINELLRMIQKPDAGKIRERTAWSCPHGDLIRWHGECSCVDRRKDQSWKSPFYAGMHSLNGFVTNIVTGELGNKYIGKLSENFEHYLENSGGAGNGEQSLLSAKASSLAAVVSCGTFFDSPHTSGRINALMAIQALLHLEEAGLDRAAESGREILRAHLGKKSHLFADQSGDNPFNDLLR